MADPHTYSWERKHPVNLYMRKSFDCEQMALDRAEQGGGETKRENSSTLSARREWLVALKKCTRVRFLPSALTESQMSTRQAEDWWITWPRDSRGSFLAKKSRDSE